LKAGGNAIRSNEREELCNEREGLSSESSTLLQTSATVALSLSLSRFQCLFYTSPCGVINATFLQHPILDLMRNTVNIIKETLQQPASQPASVPPLATSLASMPETETMGAKFAATNTERSPTAATPEQ
jgi:hypothetical protein